MTTSNNTTQAADKEIHEEFERRYAMDADDPASAIELGHFANGWRAAVSKLRAPITDLRPHLEWALRRIRTSLDTGDKYEAAQAALDAAVAAPVASAPVAGEPFMYGIMGPDGKAHFEEFCVSGDRSELQTEVVDHLNRDNPEGGTYSVVALFRDAAPQASPRDFAKLQSAYVGACDQIAKLLAEKQASAEPLVRYCPGCGSVGPVGDEYRDCCPDGGEARIIPAPLAEKCRDTFKIAVKALRADAAANEAMANQVPAVTEEYTLRAMARNYTDRHSWDKLDSKAITAAADEIERLRAELSQVRAPVADERAAFARSITGRDDLEPHQVQNVIDANGSRWATWRDRAALATVPLPNQPPIRLSAEVLEYLKEGIENATQCEEADIDHDFASELGRLMQGPLFGAPPASAPVDTPAPEHFKPPFDNCSFRMCDLPGQCRGEGKCHHPAIAPVAGEAKNYPGDNVAERLDKMADGQPPGSQAQSDLYAAATIWRKHIAHRAAPQASAVAGEAVTWEAVRQELAIFLMGATGRSSKEWHRPLDNASEGGALARMRACLAAPQASAENVRNAALEEAAKLMDQTLRSNGAALIRGLKRSQAHKDGGQQRAGDAALARLAEPHTGMRVDYQGLLRQAREGLHDSPGLAEMLRQLQGHLRELGQRWYAGDTAVVDELLQLYCVESNARAALSATQAEQGERDE
ncbi:hypothetical protein [Achromobacter xylosoxidans]|uniref:Uncharacterized protein n=3 Tax=Alcaligenes xylosoxydans xylosoxydans TaxID=85698 RepID=A0A1R1JM95_ALCXX|nr:hypothetical protein [Achromobacter xylosoxidans]OMG79324.1 hypothetical protein BIZ92_15110 [Achromobacter xylosoxidans]